MQRESAGPRVTGSNDIVCVHTWTGHGPVGALIKNAKRHTDYGPEYPHEEWEKTK